MKRGYYFDDNFPLAPEPPPEPVVWPNRTINATTFWRRYPLFGDDPSNIYYGSCSVDPEPEAKRPGPVLLNPVPVAFDPMESIHNNDGKEHEGVSFAELWADPVARTLWLGYKRFQITSQYFRRGCIDQAFWLRKKPGYLLEERVGFALDGSWWGSGSGWEYELGPQLIPHLIWALGREAWPYFWLPGACELRWHYAAEKKVA